MTRPRAQSLPVAIEFEADNGTVPPPYRRSTRIEVDTSGNGRLTRLCGYDLTDPARRCDIPFQLSADQLREFAQLVDSLAVFDQEWIPGTDAPVGGPLTYLSLLRGETRIRIPPHPRRRQREAAEALRSGVRGLVPAEVVATYRAWEAANGGEE